MAGSVNQDSNQTSEPQLVANEQTIPGPCLSQKVLATGTLDTILALLPDWATGKMVPE